MNVFVAFSGMQLWLIASVTFCVIPVAAALAALLIRRGIGFERLVLSNEVAGYQYSTLGVMCAVLLALAIVAVWTDFREARRPVDREIAAWNILYRLNDVLPEPRQDAVRAARLDYGHTVVEDEWPAMAQLAGSDAAATAFRGLCHALLSVEVADQRSAAIYSEMLESGRLDRSSAQSHRPGSGLATALDRYCAGRGRPIDPHLYASFRRPRYPHPDPDDQHAVFHPVIRDVC
jgi:hypothetical protein